MLQTQPILQDSPLEKIQSFLALDMQRVNTLILERLSQNVPLINQVAEHIIQAGGKRLRPMLTLLCARLAGYTEGNRHINLAGCIEFIHTATLLHDDVIDHSDQRRGRPSANAIWGNEASILVGDFLFSRAFELMVQDGSSRVLEILSPTVSIIAEGEMLQLSNIGNFQMSEETYYTIIASKTASLFSAACEIGGALGNKGEELSKCLKNYGHNFGMLFQLIDDVLDYRISPKNTEDFGNDLREGKITLPLLLAYKRAEAPQKLFLKTLLLNSKNLSASDFSDTISIMTQLDIMKLTHEIICQYERRALKDLEGFPPSIEKTLLEELLNFCLSQTS